MNHEKIMRKSFLVNVSLVIMKFLAGFIFNSTSLIADGVHSLSDFLSDVFVIIGIKKSKEPADNEHPIGHGKFEYILSLFLGVSVIIIAYGLGKSIVENWNDEVQIPSPLSLIVVLIVILVKVYLARYLIKQGKEVKSQVIVASGKESFTDVLSSGFVLLGIILVLIGNYFDLIYLTYSDKIASCIVTLLIFKVAIEIINDSIKAIMGERVSGEINDYYQNIILSVDGVIDISRLLIIYFGPYYQVLVDIVVDGDLTVKEGHEIASRVSNRLYSNDKICHVTVHVDPKE